MSQSRRGFVAAGSWCLDQNRTVPFWPGEDMAVTVIETLRGGGGSACNFGVDVRRLDAATPVETIGLVGDDEAGRFLAAVADRHGVGRSRLQATPAAPTHVTDAYQSLASGRRTHIIHEGASALLSPDHFDLDGVEGRILHLGLPGIHAVMDAPWGEHPNGWVAVLKRAKAAGLETNMELVAVPAQRLRALALPCLPYLDMLVVNDFEIGALAGVETIHDGVADPEACREAAIRALEMGAMEVVVAHYVEGAELVARDGTRLRKSSLRVPKEAYRGANGAGDAFAAGFLYARHEGWDYERALTLAHATAASSLRSVATTDGVGTVAECLALVQEWGWR